MGNAGLPGGCANVSVLPSLTRMISAGCSIDAQHGVDFADEPGQIFRLVVKRNDDGKRRIREFIGARIRQKTESQA